MTCLLPFRKTDGLLYSGCFCGSITNTCPLRRSCQIRFKVYPAEGPIAVEIVYHLCDGFPLLCSPPVAPNIDVPVLIQSEREIVLAVLVDVVPFENRRFIALVNALEVDQVDMLFDELDSYLVVGDFIVGEPYLAFEAYEVDADFIIHEGAVIHRHIGGGEVHAATVLVEKRIADLDVGVVDHHAGIGILELAVFNDVAGIG